MAKNVLDEHNKMLSDRQKNADEEKKCKQYLKYRMEIVDNSQGAGLSSMMGNISHVLTPLKNSAHSTNLKINEDASTIASSTANCGNSSGSNDNKKNPF